MLKHRTLGFLGLALLAIGSACAAGAPTTGACGDQSKVPAAERVKNTAHWTTASEEENFGYDVYRGDSEEGPFVKIPAPRGPGVFRYVDAVNS